MRIRRLITFALLSLALQACMPDSFTKFKEDPVKKGDNIGGPDGNGGGGDDDDDDVPTGPCPPGSELTDGNCLNPTGLSMTTSSIDYQLDSNTYGQEVPPIAARALKASGQIDPQNPANWLEFFTFTISPSILPPGFSFNVNTGVITGAPIAFFPKTIYTISAVYSGLNPVTLTGAAAATVQLSVSTFIESPVKMRPPTNHFLIVKLDDVSVFEAGDQIAFETGGSGNVIYVDEVSEEVHVEANNSIVPLIEFFDQGIENPPTRPVRVDNNASFIAPVASVLDYFLALNPSVTLPTNSSLPGALFFLPSSDTVPAAPNNMAITAAEIDSLAFSLTPALPAGLSFNQKRCSVNCGGFPCSTQPLCLSAGGVWSAIRPGLISGATATNLNPTGYTVSSRNIAGELVSSTFKLSSLSFPNPKSIGAVAYKQKAGQRLRLSVSSVSPFNVGEILTTEDGGLAEINFKDAAANTLFVTIQPGHSQYARFENGVGIDNNTVYFAPKAQINSEPVYLYQNTGNLDDTTQQRMDIAVAPFDYFENSANIAEDRTLVYSITPQVTNVPGIRFQVRSGCTNLTTGVINVAILTPATCVAPGFAWIRGGTMWGDPDPLKPLSENEFTITATTLRGQQTTAKVKLEFTATQAPIEFSLSRNVLLEVPSVGNAFEVGDFVSSNQGGGNNGLGTVRAIIPAQVGSPNEYLWVNIKSGIFAVNNNIDNMKKYSKQQTYILRVIPVNASLQFADTSGFVDRLVDGSTANQITSATGTARVILNDEVNDRLYVRVSDGYFQTNQAISGNTLTQINSQNITMVINSAVPGGVTKDFDIVQGPDVNSYNASGVIRNINGTTLEVETLSNRFEVGGGSLYFSNPSIGPDFRTVNSVRTNNRRFLALKNKPFNLYPTLEAGSSNVGYEISPPLPPGLIFNPTTGAISGTPEDRSAATVYTIIVSNEFTSPASSISYPITLEVKDFLELSVSTNANSYILHQGGMGKNRSECLITRDQLQSSSITPRDINCILDGGEFDLFKKGADLNFTVAPDMCEYIEYSPYYFATHPAAATSNADYAPGNDPLIRHVGEYDDAACTATFGPIAAEFPVAANFNTLMGINEITDFSQYCGYNYTIAEAIDPGPNCDPGELNTTTFTYTIVQVYECAPDPGLSEEDCDNEYGVCSDGVSADANDCLIAGETWTPDPGNTGTADACERTQTDEVVSCGGELYNCLSGPATEILDPKLLFEEGRVLTSPTEQGEETSINFSLTPPYNQGRKNISSIVNFKSANSCVTPGSYSYNFSKWESFAATNKSNAVADEEITTPIIGKQFYTFLCQNGSRETLARIRLVIRDWDKAFKASDDIDQLLPTLSGFPNGLMKGGSYRDEIDAFGNFINIYGNWDDMHNVYSPALPATSYTCPAVGPIVPTQGFPFPLDNL